MEFDDRFADDDFFILHVGFIAGLQI
jgi:hypothetical protein